jgi:ribosomal protein L39E
MARALVVVSLALPLPASEPDRPAIRKMMERAMGPLPGPERLVPLDVKVVSEEKLDGYVRKKLTFAAEKNDRVPAWLLVSTNKPGKRPAVLCLHQTISIGKDEPVGLGKQDSKS